jgi:hypothetical protein
VQPKILEKEYLKPSYQSLGYTLWRGNARQSNLYIYIFFYSNWHIYTAVLKFIKNKHQPSWRTAVSRSFRTPQHLHSSRRGP